MQVRTWMSPDPECVEPDATVGDARKLLHRYGFHHLPVLERGRLVGVISDRDVCDSVADDVAVRTVMSPSPQVVDAGDSIATAARTLLSRRISSLPVLDGGDFVGILTTTDCLLALLDDVSAR